MDKKLFVLLLAVLIVCGVVIVVGLSIGLSRNQGHQDGKAHPFGEGHLSASGHYRFAAVSSDSAICSSVGTEMLARHGGSAVDAAIATMICLGVVNSQHVGIGGGHIMVLYDRPKQSNKKQMKTLISRPTAPMWVTPEYFKNDPNAKETKAKSISIPCEIKGYEKAWKIYGRVSWKELFQASIDLCFDGWNVTKSMEKSIETALPIIKADPSLREAYIKENGKPYKAGDIMKAPKLGHTLRRIADEGADIFYTGSLAKDIVQDISEAGGNIKEEDMRSAEIQWWEPIKATFHNGDYQIYVAPPPSSGAITAFILKLLDQFQWKKVDEGSKRNVTASAQKLHKVIEAWEMAFALRNQAIGDREFMTNQEIQLMNQFVNDEYVKEMAAKIPDHHSKDDYKSLSDESDEDLSGGTSHLNVLAFDGGAVSVTSTVGSLFGAKVRGNRTGLIFNNDLSLFDLPSPGRSPVNYMYPKKRGRSATTPTIIMNDKNEPVMLIGSSGGTRSITSTTYVVSVSLFTGRSATFSNSMPRIHAMYNTSLYYDDDMLADILEKLRAMGHTEQVRASERYPYLGVNQVIDNRACLACGRHCKEPCIEAVSDWRKWGKPDGY